MRKYLLICGKSNSVINFRREFISFLIKRNNEVVVIAGDDEFKDEIIKMGAIFYCVPFDNRSTSIFSNLRLKKQLRYLVKKIAPNIVMTFQLKPNIFGLLSCKRMNGIIKFAMVEGLGDPFQPKNLKGKVIRLFVCILYKKAFKNAKKVFFLNAEDRDELLSRKIIPASKTIIIPGIGIDTSKYIPSTFNNKEKRVVMLARLIKNKGILEFCEIARNVKKVRKDIYFDLYGNESQLTKHDIEGYLSDGSVNYGGYINDPINLISNATILVSTSYREGFPRVILEAMALGKVVIASKVIGNKDAVIDGVTGFLLPVSNIEAFSKKIIEIIDDEKTIDELGKQARKICEQKYDSEIINKTIYDETNII